MHRLGRRSHYLAYYAENPKTALTGLFWRTWHRASNRAMDLRAALAGACNADTWDPAGARYRGYSHWRCGKARQHFGLHRFNDYEWSTGHRPTYDPIPVRGLAEHAADMDRILPFRKVTGRRHLGSSLRRARLRRRAEDQARAERTEARR